jgi:Family of unknown function (DUF695)
MSIFKKIFGSKADTSLSYKEFWDWFSKNEKKFHNIVTSNGDILGGFLDKIEPKLEHIKKDCFLYLTGLIDDDTVELVLTADGIIHNMVFIEELIDAAPAIDGWLFTAHKPACDIPDFSIEMEELSFSCNNISFYPNDKPEYPDEIDITIVYDHYRLDLDDKIHQGIYIFLDNYIGEWKSVTMLDYVKIIGKDQADKDLISITKLNDYLLWREKEFIEKYESITPDDKAGDFTIFQAETENGHLILSNINTGLLDWDAKPSHPWIVEINLIYTPENEGGMPDKETYQFLDEWEEELQHYLNVGNGHLNIGRQTGLGSRRVYLACRDFRQSSKVLADLKSKDSPPNEIEFEIFKDKYWQYFEHFRKASY